ncbi:Pentatricopeptide repeat-containing protein, chloroplastic [Glycine soja]|uniref:Pentatricopeptide repeat-containing protein, chloroplastic n=1 Tax=Glycine soja TaxID=3848 RepID=A0A0B2P6D5_GLYSO|nr:Pentatricopeptide repeat-containing protein, chloroplastic [Glycine soja]
MVGDGRLWCLPSVDEYDKLIQSLWLEALDWGMAEKLQDKVKGSGLRVKGMTKGLIRAVKEMEKEFVEAESIAAVVNNHHECHSLTIPILSHPTRHCHNLLGTYDHKLFSLLHDRKTEEAWLTYSHSTHLPNSICLSRLVFQLSYQNTLSSLTHAQSIVMRLCNEGQLHRLNANCLVLLIVSVTKVNHTLYAASFLRFMLHSSYLPHIKAWITTSTPPLIADMAP